jgi:FAD/FMN-containing dehydrogenase
MDADQIAWARSFGARMKPYARQGAYLNYLGDEGVSRVREAFGAEKFARLQALKDRYDPTNLFHNNQNIPPSGA